MTDNPPHDPPRRPPKLSKSRYVAGLQCHLRLWLQCFERDLAPPISAGLQAIFDTGHEVGEMATRRYPGGEVIDADHFHHPEAVEQTQSAMRKATLPAVFEAGFIHDDVRIRVDVLERAGRGCWDLIEVKSTASLEDPHIDDVAVQLWVLEGAGVRVRNAGVLTLDTSYVFAGGEYDLDRLFQLHDVTAAARAEKAEVEAEVAAQHAMLAKRKAPNIAPGDHCSKPYDCQFYQHCTRDMIVLDHSVTELPRLHRNKKALFESLGIASIDEIPDDIELTALQERVRESVTTSAQFVSSDLATALAEPKYPIHHLDFETFAPALPRYAGTHPYQTLPFQWSNHIQHADGTVEHQEYLCREDKDPHQEFAATLLRSVGTRGTICIYSRYEIQILERLADALPRLKRKLRAVANRCWDLCAVVRKHYYHPDFHGSFSLKSVLPALVPGMSYDGLEIAGGNEASGAYMTAIRTADADERQRLHQALLAYCKQDTEALVQLRKVLATRAR